MEGFTELRGARLQLTPTTLHLTRVKVLQDAGGRDGVREELESEGWSQGEAESGVEPERVQRGDRDRGQVIQCKIIN